MGANVSQEHVPRPPNEEPKSNTDMHTKAKELSPATTNNHDPITKAATTTTIEVKYPHNYEAIVKDADNLPDNSSINKLYAQLYAGIFLHQKKQKYWVEEKTNRNCFMVYARSLSITWSEDNRYWHWPYDKDTTSGEFVDVAELVNVCWLEVHGKFQIGKLTPGVTYQVAFVVMLRDPAYGLEVPVNLRLTLPDGTMQHHKENLMEKPRGQWIQIPVGEFTTTVQDMNREIEFSLYEYEGGKWKKGLAIKGVVITPKN